MRTKAIGAALLGFSILLIIALSMVKISIDSQSASLCSFYQEKDLDMSQCPAHKNNTSWIMTLLFGIAFLIMGIGGYIFIQQEKHAVTAPRFSDEKLDEEEKRIFELMKHNSGSAYQSDLIRETGLSKVKITRVLDKLESKGLLERKRRGMTNIIVLK
ncbi:MarR family transcriptional regulator [Candidatus Woesearchaeota archaeon]|nr:MarR family transcriptional regulator [Candidatus Woesearchaeota archaeon]